MSYENVDGQLVHVVSTYWGFSEGSEDYGKEEKEE